MEKFTVCTLLGLLCAVFSEEIKGQEIQIKGNSFSKFTKRGDDSEIGKRPFGGFLSGGYKLGGKKMDQETDLILANKKWSFGSVLGNGFKSGKRDDVSSPNGDKTFLLGPTSVNGFAADTLGIDTIESTTKQQPGVEYVAKYKDNINNDIDEVDLDGPVDDKRWIGDIFGGGYPYKRSKRSLKNKRYIHYFGNMLGRGFAFGKRDTDEYQTTGINELENYVYDELNRINDPIYMLSKNKGEMVAGADKLSSENNYPENDDDSLLDNDEIYNDDTAGYSNSNANTNDDRIQQHIAIKKYFNSDPGSRFMFGKRQYEDILKRFGNVIGNGYSFGKRDNKAYFRKGHFGHVLGSGFTLGKRTSDDGMDKKMYSTMDIDTSIDNILSDFDPAKLHKRNGWVFGRGFSNGKRRNRKRFGWVLGNGFKFGKRTYETTGANAFDDGYFIDDNGNIESIKDEHIVKRGYRFRNINPKRLGHVLGSGFVLGKRIDDESSIPEHSYGSMLGQEYELEKRVPTRKRFGNILGYGFAFGKRNSM